MLAVPSAAMADSASEAEAAKVFDTIREEPQMLRMFLQAMPKGADLHNHLSGTPSAEDYLGWAAAEGYCADPATLGLVPAPCEGADKIGRIAAERPFLYARLIDRLSTRGWQAGVDSDEVTGHTQFFKSFDLFGMVARDNVAPMMMVALRTAAGDNLTYLELMHNPVVMGPYVMGASADPLGEADLAAWLDREIPAIAPHIAAARSELDAEEAETRTGLGCGTEGAEAACDVAIRYLGSALRALPPQQVFRSLLFSFALSDADPRFVGVNIVMPEDWAVAMRDYDLHMAMFRLLEERYPDVHVTMHAGELAFGLVPPAAMKDHMAKAIASGAERIGHGTGIAYEADAPATLARMASEGIAVEVNLTSNAVILGVEGDEHPIDLYRSFGVPVTLSTDDQGILRTDLTGEYERAVTEHGFDYAAMKQVSRNGLEYAFLPGTSLWRDGNVGTPIDACSATFVSRMCKTALANSEKARLQLALEQEFEEFERSSARFAGAAYEAGSE
ncbi:adenosine deaminase [Croceicoccus mobilis]|uniref:adenosine deaminase n=2 Tax=Croceicoccus mobilis TaxID=1703339 RepID=A0A916Z201_9SPHN|nr:adenosine deaminase [Croceicoccus mobilis]